MLIIHRSLLILEVLLAESSILFKASYNIRAYEPYINRRSFGIELI